MMQDITRKKLAALLCAVVVIAVLAFYLAAFLYSLLEVSYGDTMALGVLLIYGLLVAAMILGILLSLRQRLKELNSGEEEDAKKY